MQEKPTTHLGLSCIRTTGSSMKSLHGHKQHRTKNSLRDVILGGQDGLVNMLGIALGVVAAGGSNHVLVVTGIAAAITESISMGAVAYTSFGSERDFYLAEKETEQSEISSDPEEERQEIREIYSTKGFSGQLLDDVVSTITSNRETWVSTMMDEELHIKPIEEQSLLRSSAIVTVATLVGHLIPLAPFLAVTGTPAVVAAIVLSGVTLFAVGAYSAKTLIGDWRKSGLQMLMIGLGAAAVGFVIGRLLQTI